MKKSKLKKVETNDWTPEDAEALAMFDAWIKTHKPSDDVSVDDLMKMVAELRRQRGEAAAVPLLKPAHQL